MLRVPGTELSAQLMLSVVVLLYPGCAGNKLFVNLDCQNGVVTHGLSRDGHSLIIPDLRLGEL